MNIFNSDKVGLESSYDDLIHDHCEQLVKIIQPENLGVCLDFLN